MYTIDDFPGETTANGTFDVSIYVAHTYSTVIKTFKCQDTERLARDERTGAFSAGVEKAGRRKLAILDTATSLDDLRSPPGNRLERLKGERGGQHSIRVNDQFRLCFRWADGDAYDVEITDYHD